MAQRTAVMTAGHCVALASANLVPPTLGQLLIAYANGQ